jgi:hypothetical protein
MSALAPLVTRSQFTPSRSHSPSSTGLPATTPIEPVSVAGWATSVLASAAIQ